MEYGDNLPLRNYQAGTGQDSPEHKVPSYSQYSETENGQLAPKPAMPWGPMSASLPRKTLPPTPTHHKSRNKRIDFVLVYENKDLKEIRDHDDKRKYQKHLDLRMKFIKQLDKEGIHTQEDVFENTVFLKLHTSFTRLCQEAENVKLEMPLNGCEIYDDGSGTCWTRFVEKYLETDDEVDFVSAPFDNSKIELYEGYTNKDTFFRPALRSFLTRQILINMDVRDQEPELTMEEGVTRQGLLYFLMKNIFSDSFILHDEAANDLAELEEIEIEMAKKGQKMTKEEKEERKKSSINTPDTRRDLDTTWCKPFKYQPLWKIRNYFGEKIALYFAWSGALITSLWLPALFGLGVFIYGLVLSMERRAGQHILNANSSFVDAAKEILTSSLDSVKEAFDNNVTPYFALVICLWGTVFLEYWKRTNATLAYEWDVDSFESSEPDRPQFYGTKKKPDPVTLLETWYYPMKRKMIKFSTSAAVLCIMVCVVFISVAAVILYRVIMSIDFCGLSSEIQCLLVTTICSSILNAVSILLLGKIYEKLAVLFTDWENHRTQTEYDDALILKLFAFQFANSYSSLFYIAFFRGYLWPDGMFGLGPEYQDTCGTYNYTTPANSTRPVSARSDEDNEGANCMSMLSFQLLTVMIIKPLPKFLKDIVLPWLKSVWKKRQCLRKTKVHDEEESEHTRISSFMEREYNKPELNDFTLAEYTEKVIMYGYVMLFSASFSLGPLLVLIITLIDIRVDGKRLLWMYRRPIAYISQDIGMWFNILTFLNVCGVVSNAFLVAFTSGWGQKYDLPTKLWIVIGFEHIILGVGIIFSAIIPDVPKDVTMALRRNFVFFLKFILAILIPDVPHRISLSVRREKYQVAKILAQADSYIRPGKSKLSGMVQASELSMLGTAPPISDSNDNDIRQRRKKKKGSLPPLTKTPRELGDQEGHESPSKHWSVTRTAMALKPTRMPDPETLTNDMGELNYDSDGATHFADSGTRPFSTTEYRMSLPEELAKISKN